MTAGNNKQKKPITVNVGLVGLGTVGTGVAKILISKRSSILKHTGIDFCIKSVAVKSGSKKRDVKIPKKKFTKNWKTIVEDPAIDQVVELIGGTKTALNVVGTALKNKKDVITANKALFSECGHELYGASMTSGAHIGFEAAVAGGIPIIQGMKEGLASNKISKIVGILNGTCNYILSQMTQKNLDYSTALKQAQAKGFAEADPKLDVDGTDTAHKLTILSRLAFKKEINLQNIGIEGIERIDPIDIQYSKELGYVIKLLAIARRFPGELELHVQPTLLPCNHFLSNVHGENNAILIQGDFVGDVLFYGKGAGQNPTASAVVSDMINIALISAAGIQSKEMIHKNAKVKRPQHVKARYYLRLQVRDKPGVMGFLTKTLGDGGVSLASVHQKEINRGNATIVILTHKSERGQLNKALLRIRKKPFVKTEPVVFQLLDESGMC